MLKALISVTVVMNKCIGRLWETDIGTVEYSIATTFRSTSTDTILYWEYVTVPYHFSVNFNPYVSKNYGDWIDYAQFMTVRPCTDVRTWCTIFVRNCTQVQYVTVRYRDINGHQTEVNIIFVNLEWGHFEFIFYLRSQVLGTNVPRVIEKRELLCCCIRHLKCVYIDIT
jgi:hypothetical protein